VGLNISNVNLLNKTKIIEKVNIFTCPRLILFFVEGEINPITTYDIRPYGARLRILNNERGLENLLLGDY